MAGSLAPHDAADQLGLRSGLRKGAPLIQVGFGEPWAVPSSRFEVNQLRQNTAKWMLPQLGDVVIVAQQYRSIVIVGLARFGPIFNQLRQGLRCRRVVA